MRRLIVALALLLGATAQAQMPDLRRLNGQPLPAKELPAGTVNVRVSKQLPMNGVPGIEVSAIVTNPGGDSRKRVATTGPDGRANFEVTPGHTFEASVTVDGELLKTLKFPVPETGGTKILLIAALGGAAAEPEGQQEVTGDQKFALGSVTGRVEPQPGLPAGTLEIALVDDGGRPIAGRQVQLGQVGGDNAVRVFKALAGADGVARFEALATGEETGYAAIIEHQGMRLGTEAFRMSATAGMRGQIRALGRTSDPKVLRFDNRARLILEVGEDALQMMEELIFKNVSDKVFDPGAEGVVVPLPDGFSGAKELEGSAPVEVRAGQGVAVKSPIPPNSGALFATRIRVGFVVPADGSSSVIIEQKLPFGLEGALLLVPESAKLTPEAVGLRAGEVKADAQGNKVKLYDLDPIAPGGTLALTVRGLPALDRTGRNITGVLCLVLVLAAVVGFQRPRETAHAQNSAAQLSDRREKLFAELVALEHRRRAGGKGDAALEEQRQALVTRLETVYRELAQVAHGPLP